MVGVAADMKTDTQVLVLVHIYSSNTSAPLVHHGSAVCAEWLAWPLTRKLIATGLLDRTRLPVATSWVSKFKSKWS